jgi:hypothetical protein
MYLCIRRDQSTTCSVFAAGLFRFDAPMVADLRLISLLGGSGAFAKPLGDLAQMTHRDREA